MINYDTLTTPQKQQMNAFLAQQRYLEQTADVWYQCYVEHISYADFWAKYLWGKVSTDLFDEDWMKTPSGEPEPIPDFLWEQIKNNTF